METGDEIFALVSFISAEGNAAVALGESRATIKRDILWHIPPEMFTEKPVNGAVYMAHADAPSIKFERVPLYEATSGALPRFEKRLVATKTIGYMRADYR